MDLGEPEMLRRLAVALAVGLLIGFERGWTGHELDSGKHLAGLRTFAVIGLLGGVSMLVAGADRGFFLAAVAVGLGVVIAAGYWRISEADSDTGITSVVAILLTFGLGALAGLGHVAVAIAAAVVATLLLGTKIELHGLMARLDRSEVLATLQLLLISVVLLPILPDRGFGPWDALNPYRLWWLVVLVAAVSYVGYFLIRLTGGRRGLLLTGLLGGLVSSMAVTLHMARLSKERPAMTNLLAAAVVMAVATMFPRLVVIAGVVAPTLVAPLLSAMLPAALVGFLLGWHLVRRGRGEDGDAAAAEALPGNPFEIKTAVKFGLLLAAVMLIAKGAKVAAGDAGLYAAAAASGLADVDAIMVSLASMVGDGGIGVTVAVAGTVLAAAANTLIKPLVVAVVGDRGLALKLLLPLALTLAAAGAGVGLAGGLEGDS